MFSGYVLQSGQLFSNQNNQTRRGKMSLDTRHQWNQAAIVVIRLKNQRTTAKLWNMLQHIPGLHTINGDATGGRHSLAAVLLATSASVCPTLVYAHIVHRQIILRWFTVKVKILQKKSCSNASIAEHFWLYSCDVRTRTTTKKTVWTAFSQRRPSAFMGMSHFVTAAKIW